MAAFEVVDLIPLAKDTLGVYRIGGTRVTLDSVVLAFLRGATAEEIAQKFPVLDLAESSATMGHRNYWPLARRVAATGFTSAVVGSPQRGVKWLADENFDNGIVRGLLQQQSISWFRAVAPFRDGRPRLPAFRSPGCATSGGCPTGPPKRSGVAEGSR